MALQTLWYFTGLPQELVSIIEKETQHIAEMSTIAGVYLNRLNGSTKSGKMRLQADPTINYCRVKSGKKRRNRIYIKKRL